MDIKNENPGANNNQVQDQQSPDYSSKSISELKKLANTGNPDAMFELGHRYRNGIGCRYNESKSEDWFAKALANGLDIVKYRYHGVHSDKEHFDSVLLVYQNYVDDHFWGIQAFDKPQEAWEVMTDTWLDLYILNDEEFEKIIFRWAVISLCLKHFHKIDKEKCNMNLGLKGINDYLVDFDFFLYSEKTKRYYTSRMSMKSFYNAMWSSRQWKIFYELWDAYDFDDIVDRAIVFFNVHRAEIDAAGLDGYRQYLDDEGLSIASV